MRTTQCPKCPLRFSTRNELLWHLRQDHRRTTGLGLPDLLCPRATGASAGPRQGMRQQARRRHRRPGGVRLPALPHQKEG
jgi:hypothetical protein